MSFTTRVSAEYHERFYALVDGQKMSVCETFERAVMALERETMSRHRLAEDQNP